MNEGGDDSGQKPRPGQCANQKQNEDGFCGGANAVGNGVADVGPRGSTPHAQRAREQGREQQGDLVGTVRAVFAEVYHVGAQQGHEQHDGR